MIALSDLIEVHHRNVRAVNLDTDLGSADVLESYAAGAHILDAMRRIASGMQDGPRSRAWSITGPYGSGKSSFAVFALALLGPAASDAHSLAVARLSSVDRQLADLVGRERARVSIGRGGVIPAAAVAGVEPTVSALMRALLRGAETWSAGRSGRKPKAVHELRAAVDAKRTDPEILLGALDELCAIAPVLLVIDELGKTLQYAADYSGEGDLFVLQQIAERFSSSATFSGAILTLQHLSFEDYLIGAADARRREWRKVHGRFEDIPFICDSLHALHLLSQSLRPVAAHSATMRQVTVAARAAEHAVRTVAPHLVSPSEVVGVPTGIYPLHPLTALALPVLASRFGQHDRSLVAFLASDAPTAIPAFLAAHSATADPPFLRPAALYDFFLTDTGAAALAGRAASQLSEIQARVDNARLDRQATAVLKTVAVLNLASGAEGLSASTALITEAVVGPAAHAEQRDAVAVVLQSLVERSLLMFRDFAGEYRVWEGSDFDIVGQVAAARDQLAGVDATDQMLRTVAAACGLRPAVAQRHSQVNHILRYFERRLATPSELDAPQCRLAGADGLILHVLSEDPAPSDVPAACIDGRPLIVVWAPHARQLRELTLDVAAAAAVLQGAPELANDIVARRELRHRVGVAQTTLAGVVEDLIDPLRDSVQCFAAGSPCAGWTPAAFSALISAICDERFCSTPVIRNEMVNGSELTSQGAKARRTLLERMFVASDMARLGIEGFGPERAMYEAVLAHTGLHAERHGVWTFGPPRADGGLLEVWTAVMGFLDAATDRPRTITELYGLLQAPPFGLKSGPIPILLSAALIHRADDTFLYQDGTFQPSVDEKLLERMLKTPERFAVKRAALVGLRAEVFDRLRDLYAPGPQQRRSEPTRNATTLSVVRPLIAFVNALPEFSRQTGTLGGHARAVCATLLDATEPDALLFVGLPAACGLPAISGPRRAGTQVAEQFVSRLRSALAELGGAYPRLLDRVEELLGAAFVKDTRRLTLRDELRTSALRLVDSVIDPKLRAFLLTAADDQLDDREWLEALAMTVTAKPPTAWTDHDVVVFEALLAERAGWFKRLQHLHFDRTHRDTAFDARRITLTAPNGDEWRDIVTVDAATREIAAAAIGKALEHLAGTHDDENDAALLLLGALAARVLTPASDTTAVVSDAQPKLKKAQ